MFYYFAFIHTGFVKNRKTRPLRQEYSCCAQREFFESAELLWNQWLAGLIDGDGCLLVQYRPRQGLAKVEQTGPDARQPKGYCSCEITMDLRDEHALQQIKNKLGGGIKLRSGVKAFRYRLHHREGLQNLIKRINGEIRYQVRQEQLKRQCLEMQVPFIQPTSSLSKKNGWFAGVFDADGTVTLRWSEQSAPKNTFTESQKHFAVSEPSVPFDRRKVPPQCTISVSAKREEDLLPWKVVFGGNIYFDKSSRTYKWCIQAKEKVLEFVQYTKNVAPSRSSKKNGLYLIPRLYELIDLRAYKADKQSKLYSVWEQFLEKWKSRTL